MTIILMWNDIHFEYMQFTLHPVPIIYKTRRMFPTKYISLYCLHLFSINYFPYGQKKKAIKSWASSGKRVSLRNYLIHEAIDSS